MSEERRTADRRVSPAVGEYAIQECAKQRAVNATLLAALMKMVSNHDDMVAAGFGVAEDADHARAAIAKAEQS